MGSRGEVRAEALLERDAVMDILLEPEMNDAYVRWLFQERQCVRLVCLTEEAAVIRVGTNPLATDGENVDVELSTLNERSRAWLRGMKQSADETERSFETARVMAERARMRLAFSKARRDAQNYQLRREGGAPTGVAVSNSR